MADNLARSSGDSFDEDPSLDSILNRLNSLGESTQDDKESARALRGVPDLSPDDTSSVPDSSDDPAGPASLSIVKDSDAPDSPFRSQGLFDISTADTSADSPAVAAPVASPDALSSLLDKDKDKDDSTEDDSEKEQSEVEETEVAETEEEDEEKPERIDYFADLHAGDSSEITSASKFSKKDSELDLEPGVTVQQAFSEHPEGKPPEDVEIDEDVILTDTHGLLADPLDIKDVATTMDAAAYEEHFSHGVQFPGIEGSRSTFGSNVDPSDPLYVANPYDGMEAPSKGLSLKSVVSALLLIGAILVLVLIIGDGEAVDDLRDGVTVITD